MSAARDWLTTLWPASYNGVPFFFDKDHSLGGRDVVVHEFPHRDDPFNEDLGRKPRYYEGDAYVHGDDADAQAATFENTLDGLPTPGILVVPTVGPVPVRCLTYKRTDDKDKNGYIAFTVKFVREGAAGGLISVPLAGRLVAVAADAISAALANVFPAALALTAQPNFVVAAASDGVQSIAATIEVTRQSWPLDPAVSANLRDGVIALVAAAPLLLTDTPPADADVAALAASVSAFVPAPSTDGPTLIAQSVTGMVRALGGAMAPVTAAASMLDFADAFSAVASAAPPAAVSSANVQANITAVNQLARLSALTAWAEALALQDYPDRPAGVTARADAVVRFDVELMNAPGASNAVLFVAIEELRGRVVDYLSRLINDLAPVIEIKAPRIMPSLFWAWRLYADPTRAAELVARNAVKHPSFMPTEFAALAPQ